MKKTIIVVDGEYLGEEKEYSLIKFLMEEGFSFEIKEVRTDEY